MSTLLELCTLLLLRDVVSRLFSLAGTGRKNPQTKPRKNKKTRLRGPPRSPVSGGPNLVLILFFSRFARGDA